MAMQFLQPLMLWSLLLLPLMVIGYLWLLKRRRKQVVAFPAVSWILQNMKTPSPWRRHVPPALLALALALLLLASARPMARVTLPADYMTLIMAMDVSRSMLAEDVEPSRIKAAQKAAKEFLQDLPANVRVAIVSFATGNRHRQWLAVVAGHTETRGQHRFRGGTVQPESLWVRRCILQRHSGRRLGGCT
jgi:Ca-activated chloride channel family protein